MQTLDRVIRRLHKEQVFIILESGHTQTKATVSNSQGHRWGAKATTPVAALELAEGKMRATLSNRST